MQHLRRQVLQECHGKPAWCEGEFVGLTRSRTSQVGSCTPHSPHSTAAVCGLFCSSACVALVTGGPGWDMPRRTADPRCVERPSGRTDLGGRSPLRPPERPRSASRPLADPSMRDSAVLWAVGDPFTLPERSRGVWRSPRRTRALAPDSRPRAPRQEVPNIFLAKSELSETFPRLAHESSGKRTSRFGRSDPVGPTGVGGPLAHLT